MDVPIDTPPASAVTRYIALMFMCFMGFGKLNFFWSFYSVWSWNLLVIANVFNPFYCPTIGNYFVFDLPGSIQEKLTNDMSISTAQYSLLYSWYSWPNVVLCFFGGYLTDKVFGIRWGAIIFCTIILIGQFFIALGAFLNMFWLMCLGRL